MRNGKFDRLLAGSVLAAIIAAPGASLAAPDRVESIRALPPSLNGERPRHREANPVPPPTPQAAAPQPQLASVQPTGGDIPTADQLREIITNKQFDKRVPAAAERKAIETYYGARNYAPIWLHDGELTANAKAAIARLKSADIDGLDAADYPLPDFGKLSGGAAMADADIKLTVAVMTYARHLAVGRVAPSRVVTEVDYGAHSPDPVEILRKVAEASDASAALDGFNPPHEGFRALKDKLAELRRTVSEPDERIATGAVIKPGAKDERVPALRQRLGVGSKPDDLVYDKVLLSAIKAIQARADIKPTGLIDGKTIAVINGPTRKQQIERVTANMERWRWLPRDLGRTYVMVNIPDFTLKVVRGQNLVWRTKIVVGKPTTPTPLLSAAMDSVLVNPSWYVPQSIIQNELLPAYETDPRIFDRMGLEVRRGPDGNINVVQPPGAANALGRIKFNFSNKFHVYLHDTPEKKLFAYERRAFSHGCMRVEDPTKFGEVVLRLAMNGPTPDQRQIIQMFGQDEHTFELVRRPMVHLTYQTAFVDDGKLVLRDDIYGLDARIHAIMTSDERRIADTAPPPEPKQDVAVARANQDMLRRVERREAGNPFSIFDRLLSAY